MNSLGKIIVIDCEMNCDETGWSGDLIQIGLVLVNRETKRISKPRRIYCQSATPITSFCTELTGITDAIVKEKGKTPQEVCDILHAEFHWTDFSRVVVGWGEDNKVLPSVPLAYLNLARAYSTLMLSPRRLGLDDALAHFGLTFEGRRHDGGDDAYNTARVLLAMSKKFNVLK